MKEAGCRLLIVGYESGDQQILKNIKKGATVERARQFTKDCHKLGLVVHGDFILGLPGETRETIKNTIKFAKELDVETIQVSVAHAYPGTELHESAIKNGFMTSDTKMVDDSGHQMVQIEYPGLPAAEIPRGSPSLLRRILFPSEGCVPHFEESVVRQLRTQAPVQRSADVPETARPAPQVGQGKP